LFPTAESDSLPPSASAQQSVNVKHRRNSSLEYAYTGE